jgi:hypothetical protein
MRKLFVLFIILSAHFALFAQERTQIPYSIYGLGKIQAKGFGRNMAMGRSGLALSSPRYLNNQNPASYYSIDSVSFFFDFGLSLDAVKYKTDLNAAQRGMDMNIRNLAIGFRITPHWTSSMGITPYSMVGYKIVSEQPIEGTPDEVFTAQINGNGGLTQFYWNNSYLLFKHLSLGASFNYLFGSVESVEKISSNVIVQDNYIEQISYYHKVYADFGIQYFFPVKKDLKITLGGVFGNNHKINIKDRINIYNSQGSIIKDETLSRGTFEFPLYFGAGVAVTYKDKLTLSADYLFHDWSNTKADNRNYNYRSNNTYRFGAEYIPGRYSELGYFGGISYRAGLYYEESYLEIDDKSFSDQGFTLGIGLPFLQSRTSLNISYNYGINGTMENHLIKERYNSFMFSITMHDWWFIKRKID